MSPPAHTDRGSIDHGSPESEHLGHQPGQVEPILQPSVQHDQPRFEPASLHESRSTRARKAPARLDDYICYSTRTTDPLSIATRLQDASSGMCYPIANCVTCANFSVSHKNFLAAITKVTEPKYYHEAAKDPRWRDAMAERIRALEQNETWVLQDLPPGKKPISCKWVYRIKYNSDGSIQQFKARLVIRGDYQVEGFDYNETFAPVAKMTSVRCFLSVAIAKG